MNHAQMEAFQFLLDCANMDCVIKNHRFDKDVLFSYEGKLFTGDFRKERRDNLSNILTTDKQLDANNYFYWVTHYGLQKNHLLFQVDKNTSEFAKILDSIDIEEKMFPEIIFKRISNFVKPLAGDPVTPFLYNLNEYGSGVKIPFIETSEDAVFEPITLIDKNN